jgi:hypothetical protein
MFFLAKNGSGLVGKLQCTRSEVRGVMAKRDEPKSKIGDLTDAEVYDAIRYMEQDLESSNGRDKVVVICLYLAQLLGLVFWWLHR